MDKPYRFRKRLVKTGGSYYVHVPIFWIEYQKKKGKKKVGAVILEVYDDKIVITAEKQNMEIRPVNKMLVGLDENGELDVIETDELEEGMFKISDEEQNMEENLNEKVIEKVEEWAKFEEEKINSLKKEIDRRFEILKKVIGDYLELSSSLAIASVRANLKNV